MVTKYYLVLEAIVTKKEPQQSSDEPKFCFVPLVNIEDLQTGELRTRAESLVDRVEAYHVALIDTRLRDLYESSIQNFAQWASKEVLASLWNPFLLANYFDVVESIFEASTAGHVPATSRGVTKAGEIGSASSAPFGSMFESPRKRVRRQPASAMTGDVQFRAIQALHLEEVSLTNPAALEAFVLHAPTEPRWQSITNRLTGQAEAVAVVTVLLADRTGPILFEAWRENAESMCRNFLNWQENDTRNSPLYVSIERFEIREDARAHQTPTRKLHSTEHLSITRTTNPFQESLRSTLVQPHPGLYTKDFIRLAARPPFLINISGIVSHVKQESISSSNNAMKDFRLQDNTGRYVNCKAYGRRASNICIADNSEVVLYFAMARAGLNSSAGCLWLFDTAHILELAKSCNVPVGRQLIEPRECEYYNARRHLQLCGESCLP
jgi:hypothetical protein